MKIVLGLGTNLGDREGNLAQGLDRIEKLPKTQVLALSNVYETERLDVPDEQGTYLNCCVLLETQLEPQALLDKCLTIEKSLGRVRKSYHGARTLDIDLLIGEGERRVLTGGCCHCGIVNILARLAELEPEPPDAVIGGFHLAVPGTGELDEALVDGVAARLLALPGTRYYTGHCTGLASYARLKEKMGQRVAYLHAGETLEL